MKRHFAILKDHKDNNNVNSWIIDKIKGMGFQDCSIYLFSQNSNDDPGNGVEFVKIPENLDNEAKRRNYISKWFKLENVKDGMLYVIRDYVELDADKFPKFVPDIERFMDFFGYRVWLNTVCDECNYVFNRFDTRITVKMDDERLAAGWKDDVLFTTNANLDLMVYNLDKIDISEMLLDESFSVAMFVIIKFLAERRNKKIPGCYMNLYPTVPSEKGIAKKHTEIVEEKVSREEFNRQMKVFTDMKINNEPTIDAEEAVNYVIDMIEKRIGK